MLGLNTSNIWIFIILVIIIFIKLRSSSVVYRRVDGYNIVTELAVWTSDFIIAIAISLVLTDYITQHL